MRVFTGIAEAADAATDAFNDYRADLPAHLVDKVRPHTRTGSSPVDLIVHFTEAVYANSGGRRAKGEKDLPKEVLEVAAGTANLINLDGYHGRLDDRAAAMSFALRRDSGEKAGEGRAWPEKDEDPAPKADYAKPVKAEAPGAGAAG